MKRKTKVSDSAKGEATAQARGFDASKPPSEKVIERIATRIREGRSLERAAEEVCPGLGPIADQWFKNVQDRRFVRFRLLVALARMGRSVDRMMAREDRRERDRRQASVRLFPRGRKLVVENNQPATDEDLPLDS